MIFAEIQVFIILLNSQGIRSSSSARAFSSAISPATQDLHACIELSSSTLNDHGTSPRHVPTSDRTLMIRGCVELLNVFLFLWNRKTAILICRMFELQAINAATILVVDAQNTFNDQNLRLLQRVQVALTEIRCERVHGPTDLAFQHFFNGLALLIQRQWKYQDPHSV